MKRMSGKSADWAAKQADAIVTAFLDDDDADDLLRLERAIAEALHAAYMSGKKGYQGRVPRSIERQFRRKKSA